MPIYSYSKLSTFDQCPLKYKYRYLDRIKPEIGESIEAFMGSRVHEVLKKLYSDLILQKKNTLSDLLFYYKKIWEEKWYEEIEIKKNGYTEKNYFDIGKKCIENYYKRFAPFDEITLGVEERILIKLDPQGRYFLEGKIDRLVQVGPSQYEIHDYKTSTSLPSQEIISQDRQLALYQIGVCDRWPDVREVCLVWHYLVFDKDIKAFCKPQVLEKLKWETLETIKKIEATQEYPPKKSTLCDWCEYRDRCPSFKHVYKFQDLAEKQYKNEPGYVLVNRYAELKAKKQDFIKRIDEELAQIEQAIFNFAEKEKVNVIRGKNHQVKIKIREMIKFPAKQDKKRKELEEIILKSGKWMEVSDLSSTKLVQIVKEGKWSPDLLEKIKQFQTLEKAKTIFLSKLEEKRE